jgi:ornithine--oxo-acid transaminase
MHAVGVDVVADTPLVRRVRGRGLFCAVEIEQRRGVDAWAVCLKLRDNGLLAKPTHGDTIRLAPPLVLTEAQLAQCVEIISRTLRSLE